MIDTIFDLCVVLLVNLANLLGISYEAINVWIFVILWPIFTLALIVIIIVQHYKIRVLNRKLHERPSITNN